MCLRDKITSNFRVENFTKRVENYKKWVNRRGAKFRRCLSVLGPSSNTSDCSIYASDTHVYLASTQEMRNLITYGQLDIHQVATYTPDYFPYHQIQRQLFDSNCSQFAGWTIFVGYSLCVLTRWSRHWFSISICIVPHQKIVWDHFCLTRKEHRVASKECIPTIYPSCLRKELFVNYKSFCSRSIWFEFLYFVLPFSVVGDTHRCFKGSEIISG